MSDTKGNGKNQPVSEELQIPVLASTPIKPRAIVQPGEEVGESDGAAQGDESPQSPQQSQSTASIGAVAAREFTMSEMSAIVAQLAQGQAQMMEIIQKGYIARDNPVQGRQDRDQYAEVPMQTMEMPVFGDISEMKRRDQRHEPVDIDIFRDMDHAKQMLFLEEPVVINIHETSEAGAENPVPLYVNGRGVFIMRGEDTMVKRKYVELLLRAKPEGIRTRVTKNGEGDTKNHIDKTRALKYPFGIVRDDNARGIPWARKIRSEA